MKNSIIVDDKINKFRQEARYYSHGNKRFKFLIETAVGCFGSCPGCGFTKEERMNPKSSMISIEKLEVLFKKMASLIEFREGYNGDAIGGEIETTVINFGAGEHFMHDLNYLDNLFLLTKNFFASIPTKRNVLAFSSSGLMNTDKMEEKANIITKHLSRDQFVVDFVVDLSRFDMLKDKYSESFDFFIKHFGFIDIAVNIEKNSNIRDWEAFCKFIDERGVLNVDLVYALNGNNKHKVSIEADDFFQIYQKIIEHSNNGISLFDTSSYIRIQDNQEVIDRAISEYDFNKIIQSAAVKMMEDTIFIDTNLNANPVLFALFADVPLSHRFGNFNVGNILDDNFINLWRNYHSKLSNHLMKNYIKSNVCHDCPLLKECYLSGLPLLNEHLNIWNNTELNNISMCNNPIRPFLQAKKNNFITHKENEF